MAPRNDVSRRVKCLVVGILRRLDSPFKNGDNDKSFMPVATLACIMYTMMYFTYAIIKVTGFGFSAFLSVVLFIATMLTFVL